MKPQDLAVRIVEELTDDGSVKTFLELSNIGGDTIRGGWRLYFSLGLTPLAEEHRIRQVILDGRYGYLEPSETWPLLQPGAHLKIPIENWLFSGMQLVARQGFHLAELKTGSNQEVLLGEPTLLPPKLAPLIEPRNKWIRETSPSCNTKPLSQQAAPAQVADDQQTALIPAVKSYHAVGPSFQVSAFKITAEGLEREQEFVEALLPVGKDGYMISLSIDPSLGEAEYQLSSLEAGATLRGGSTTAVFHAIQTFRQLVQSHEDQFSIANVEIIDSPDFAHRAFFLDIARHFQTIEQIRKLIRGMSAYKMNRLQLGISNDEGWRLEIPSVPELTAIGSKRSYYRFDDSGQARALYPAWGDNHEESGGYISADEFVSLLRFAAHHHVEIIPEFNLPGHANALLRSLDDSKSFELTDPDDTSTYKSAQGYSANVVNVGLEDTYRLAKVILTDIKSMYDEAGVALSHIHFGGDEVPSGAWLNSPACHNLPVWSAAWDVTRDEDAKAATAALMQYHYARITGIAAEVAPDVITGFWHEMSPHGGQQSYYNGWTTEAGDRNIVEELLQRDQSLVISNASFLYLDMPYALDANEPGLPWAAYIDTDLIYHFDPLACWAIPKQREDQVLGLQAQLWSETVYTAEIMDYYIFPRLLAVAERCWNQTPDTEGFARFKTALRSRELPYLASMGIAFRQLSGNHS